MINDNSSLNSLNEDNNLNSSSGNTRSQSNETVNVQGVEFTKEEIEHANKPQPNVITSILDQGSVVAGTGTRDNERVNERANEASDSTDTNTGGIVSGAAKGANQS
jgi:hypothetical protein